MNHDKFIVTILNGSWSPSLLTFLPPFFHSFLSLPFLLSHFFLLYLTLVEILNSFHAFNQSFLILDPGEVTHLLYRQINEARREGGKRKKKEVWSGWGSDVKTDQAKRMMKRWRFLEKKKERRKNDEKWENEMKRKKERKRMNVSGQKNGSAKKIMTQKCGKH